MAKPSEPRHSGDPTSAVYPETIPQNSGDLKVYPECDLLAGNHNW